MNPDGAAIQFILAANSAFTPKFSQAIHWKRDQNYWFLTSQKTFDLHNDAFKRRVEVIQTGRLGHQTMVVFQLRQ